MSNNIQEKVVVLDRLLSALLMGVFRQSRPNHVAACTPNCWSYAVACWQVDYRVLLAKRPPREIESASSKMKVDGARYPEYLEQMTDR